MDYTDITDIARTTARKHGLNVLTETDRRGWTVLTITRTPHTGTTVKVYTEDPEGHFGITVLEGYLIASEININACDNAALAEALIAAACNQIKRSAE